MSGQLTRFVQPYAGLLAVLALVLAAAYPMQINGWNQNAHYALARAVAAGTPTIDRSRHEIGDLGTGDVATADGHTYSNKAPGLAFLSVPSFLLLDAIGMRTTGDPTRIVWALHVFTIVPAFAVLLLVVRGVAGALEPGLGTAAAITVGAGTLLLPFATLYFSHVLAAALCVAAFAVLFAERRTAQQLGLVAAGGALAGLAVAVEYPPAIAAVVLGVYTIARRPVLQRAAAYTAGAVAGTAPLLLYNLWAFGSLTHLSYERNQVEELESFFGTGVPRLDQLGDLLFSAWGLLTNTPVVAAGLVGAALLARRGHRRPEAAVLLAVPLIHLAYNAGIHFAPFGGQGLPRYLVYTLPFVGIGLATAYRAFPLTTVALAGVSVLPMATMTATNPLAAYDGGWLARLEARDVSQTAAAFVDVTGWYTIIPFFVALAAAVGLAVLDTPRLHVERRDAAAALAALAAWAMVALNGSNPNGREFGADYVVVVAGAAAAAVILLVVWPRRPVRPRPI